MKQNKVDMLVLASAILLLVMLVGMVFDIWPFVFFTIPILSAVLLGLGALNVQEKWGPLVPWIVGFGIVSTVLFIWAGMGMLDQEQSFGGLSLSAGVLVYVIWPLSSLTLGLLYAYMFKKWLKWDIDKK